MGVLFTNNASTTLSAAISSTSATSISVASSSTFPSPGAGEYFYATIDDGTNIEIVKVTAVSGTTWTVVRASDNTSAATFANGTTIQLRTAAALLTDIQQNIAAKSANQTVYNATTASSATTYNVGTDPQNEANAMVFLDGVMQHHDTFSFSGSTLTFDAAPSNGLKLEVIIDNLINLQSSNLTVDTFTATNGQTAFTLSDTPAAEDNLIVFIEGVFQNQDSYSISTNTLTMSAGVTTNRKVVVYIINPVNIGTPSDGTVTSAKLSGNITTPGTLTVGSHDVAFDSPTFVVDNSNSRVGLGTASPSVPVDIVGDVKMSSTLDLTSHLDMPDSANVKLGTGDDLLLYHDGTNSYIANTTGALKIATETSGIAVTIGHTTSETTVADNLTVTGTITGTLATAAQSAITSLGTLTALTVDNINVNGNTIKSTDSDGDLIFQGNDGGSTITALTLDMSAAGQASFNAGITSAEAIAVTNGNSTFTTASAWGATLTLKNTNDDASPAILTLHKDPASGHSTLADGDYIGFINMKAKDDAGNAHTYVELAGVATDVSHGAETSKFTINTWGAGTEYGTNLVATGGKVGIGTASPTGMLTMVDNDNGVNNEFIRLVNDPGGSTQVGTGAKISFAPHHSGTEVASISGIAETTGAGTGIAFVTHSGSSLTEKVRISKDGNLGAGTNAPQTEIHLSGANTSAGALGSVVGAGNVPSLTIQNSNATDNNLAGIFFRDDADMRSAIHSVFVSHAGGDQKSQLRFSTSSSGNMREKMTLTEDGKLGVGTTNPSAYIQVEHDISCYHGANEWVTIRGLSGGQYIEYGSGAALSFVAVDTFPHSGAATKASIRTSGALEVGAGFTSGQGGTHGLNTGVKMSSFSHVIDSTDVSNGYVDITTNIGRSAYLGISPSIYDANANVAKMGYRSDDGFITYTDGYNNLVRVGLGGDVANTDTLKCVVFYQ